MLIYPNPNIHPTNGIIDITLETRVKSAMSRIRARPLNTGERKEEGSRDTDGREVEVLRGVEEGEGCKL